MNSSTSKHQCLDSRYAGSTEGIEDNISWLGKLIDVSLDNGPNLLGEIPVDTKMPLRGLLLKCHDFCRRNDTGVIKPCGLITLPLRIVEWKFKSNSHIVHGGILEEVREKQAIFRIQRWEYASYMGGAIALIQHLVLCRAYW